MEIKILIPTFVFLQNVSPSLESSFICNSISDSVSKLNSHEKLEERIRAMEEQILQLQRLAAAGFENVTSLHKDTLPRDCAEIYNRDVKSDGIYLISPEGRCPFRVFCDMTNGGWTVIQRRMNGKVNFYRPWDDYVQGFGELDGDHWLGLDKIHRLTQAGAQIYFHMENYDGSFEHAHYKVFTVHDATTAYRMNVDAFGYEGSLNELFSIHNDMQFTTFDRDNDKNDRNCCQLHGGGGWWFESCYKFNPNGLYGIQTSAGIAYYDGKDNPVKNFLIKIKRRQGLC